MSQHYFSPDPAGELVREELTCRLWGREVRLTSGSGVYSRGRLDRGTSVLLRSVDPPEAGEVLDLGCGYGVIGLGIALASPRVRVTAVDVNERALLLTRENAASLGVARRVTAMLPDAVPPDGTYDEIWSNPPVRIGKQALHQLLLSWLPRLRAGGRAVLVVGKNLGADSLQRWLGEQGWPATRVAGAKGFRVLEVRRHGP